MRHDKESSSALLVHQGLQQTNISVHNLTNVSQLSALVIVVFVLSPCSCLEPSRVHLPKITISLKLQEVIPCNLRMLIILLYI